jgi:hypothetical protein
MPLYRIVCEKPLGDMGERDAQPGFHMEKPDQPWGQLLLRSFNIGRTSLS